MLRTVLQKNRWALRPKAQSIALRGLQGLVVGVPKEILDGEHRVAMVPINVVKLKKAGATVRIESGAGVLSGFTDLQYADAGAEIVTSAQIWTSEVVAKVRPPTAEEAAKLENRAIVSIIQPRVNTELMTQLVSQKATILSLDSLLRTLSRGQAFDVLSSQANVAGIRAVIEASYEMERPFAGQMTAAGKIAPAKVLVVGAGVAGLAAIQLAKKKGAIVYGFDVRAAAKEQVESCGAKFLEVTLKEDGSSAGGYAKEMSAGTSLQMRTLEVCECVSYWGTLIYIVCVYNLTIIRNIFFVFVFTEWFEAADKMLLEECKSIDVIITTALIPGRKAPVLIKKHHVEAMPSGGVTVDLAAASGGNVETTVAGI